MIKKLIKKIVVWALEDHISDTVYEMRHKLVDHYSLKCLLVEDTEDDSFLEKLCNNPDFANQVAKFMDPHTVGDCIEISDDRISELIDYDRMSDLIDYYSLNIDYEEMCDVIDVDQIVDQIDTDQIATDIAEDAKDRVDHYFEGLTLKVTSIR